MLKIKNTVVTGGAGFIGSHLVERLLNENCKVTVIDDLSGGKWENLPKHKNLIRHEGSIMEKNIGRFFKDVDAIFHLAALPRLQRSIAEPRLTHRVNVDGTLNLLLAARKHKVKKFIFSSSSSVYGNQNKLPFTEDMRPMPLVPYSLHKFIGEKYCQMFSDIWGLQTIILRYFNVYGPRMSYDGAHAGLIPKFIKLMSDDTAPTINGDGKQTRDFTFVTDVVEANILAARSDVSGGIFNIGRGKSISVNKVAKTLSQLMRKNIKPIYGPAVIESRTSLASNAKARKFLGWKPKVNFREGIKTMI
jgi:UDP-glucose 4-epimerase